MTRLGDLVHRASLRNRSAGDAQVGLPTGMGYHLFEVTNLTIPAGTTSRSQVLGSLEVLPGGLVLTDFYIEADSGPMTGTDQIGLTEGFNPADLWQSSGEAVFLPNTGTTVVSQGVSELFVTRQSQLWTTELHTFSEAPRMSTTLTRHVGIATAPTPLSRDIHIVRARAAFLVL